MLPSTSEKKSKASQIRGNSKRVLRTSARRSWQLAINAATIVAASIAGSHSARAATQTFDPNGNGGTGTALTGPWDTTTADWDNVGSTTPTQWTNTTTSDALFQGSSGGTVIVASPTGINLETANFNSSGYVIQGGPINLVGTTPGFFLAGNSSHGIITTTINSNLTGTLGAKFAGSSSTYSIINVGGTNTYTGLTQLQAATINYSTLSNGGSASSFGNGTGTAGIVDIGGASSAAAANYTGTTSATTDRLWQDIGTSTSVFINNNSLTGSIAFTNTGAAVSGATSHNIGLGGTAPASIANVFGETISDGGSGANITSVQTSGTAYWELTATNTNTGHTYASGGSTLEFVNRASLYNANTASWTATNINVSSGSTLAVAVGGTNQFTTADITTLLGNLGTAAGGQTTSGTGFISGALIGIDTTGATGSVTYSGVINNSTGVVGALGLNKLGTGTLILSGANTYTGATLLNGGTLGLGTNLAIQNSALNTSGSGVVALSAGVTTPTIGGLVGGTDLASVISTGYSTITALTLSPTTGLTASYSGAIADNGNAMTLNINGAGTQILAGTNTYTGATTVTTGKLQIGNGTTGSISSSSAVTVNSSTSLSFDEATGSNVTNGITNNGTILGFESASNITNTLSGNISGIGKFSQTNIGTTILSGINTFTGGVNINMGIVQVASADTLGVSGPLGKSGTILFGGGTLQYSSANNADYSNRFGATANQAFSIDTNGQSVTFNSNIQPSSGGTLTKLGLGTLTLHSSTSNYSGGTTVSAGTLLVTNTAISAGKSATGSGAVMVSAAGTLGGTGIIPGAVTVNGTVTAGSGATPGDTIGTLNTSGGQTWAAGGQYYAKLSPGNITSTTATIQAGTSGTSGDLLIMSGLTPLTSSFTVSINGLGAGANFSTGSSVLLAVDTGDSGHVFKNAITNGFLTVGSTSGLSLPTGDTLVLSEVDATAGTYGGDEELIATATAPEPTSMILLATVAAPLMLSRRRRQTDSAVS